VFRHQRPINNNNSKVNTSNIQIPSQTLEKNTVTGVQTTNTWLLKHKALRDTNYLELSCQNEERTLNFYCNEFHL